MCVCAYLEQAGQIILQELFESLVQLQAYKLSPTWCAGLFGGLCWGSRAPALAGLVDAGTIVIYMSGGEGGVKETNTHPIQLQVRSSCLASTFCQP